VTAASSRDADVRDSDAVHALVASVRPDVVLHAAGYTDVAGAETDRGTCWDVNVAGTRHVAAAAASVGTRLVHVSSDYVFWGGDDRPEGGYREGDSVGPVRNYYALSKLVAEEAARRAPNALIVRTSFRSSTWSHPVAFTDVFTGQDYVDVIAAELALLLEHHRNVDAGVLHVVTERKSAFDLAVRRNPGVRPGTKKEAGVDLPDDVSLDTGRWRAFKAQWAK
jgi:dTDP-4-dehydrorhamnose reductase